MLRTAAGNSLGAGQAYGLDFTELLELYTQGIFAERLPTRRVAKYDEQRTLEFLIFVVARRASSRIITRQGVVHVNWPPGNIRALKALVGSFRRSDVVLADVYEHVRKQQCLMAVKSYEGHKNHAAAGDQVEERFDLTVLLKDSTDFIAARLVLLLSLASQILIVFRMR